MPFVWVPKVDGPGNTIYATPLNELAAKVGDDNSADPASLDNMVRARILKSLGTAKGSLIGFTAAGTPAEIAVGANDKVLTADSTQASGVAWKDPPAGAGTWATLAAALDPTALADGEWAGLYEVCDTSALALRDPVYRTAAGGVAKGVATAGTSPVFGVVVEVGASGKVLWFGIIRNDAWGFTSHEKMIYVTTSGTIDDVAPAVVGDILQIVGRITKTDNVILVNPELVWVEVVSGVSSIAEGGTGETTAQEAIDALTAVSAATNEHVLTKDTGSGNAIWKAAQGGDGFSFNAFGNAGATPELNWSTYTMQSMTVDQATAPTFVAPSGAAIRYLLLINGGAFTITWPTMTWLGSAVPGFQSSGTDLVVLEYDGTNWYGYRASGPQPLGIANSVRFASVLLGGTTYFVGSSGYEGCTISAYTQLGDRFYLADNFAKTSDTTLATVPFRNFLAASNTPAGMRSGARYAFRAVMDATLSSTGGGKISVSLNGKTVTAVRYRITSMDSSGNMKTSAAVTSIDTAINCQSGVTDDHIILEGIIQPGVGTAMGDFRIQFAQQTSDGSPSTILALSSLVIRKVG